MHIEKRGDTEYLIGAPDEANECVEVNGVWCCVHHLNGEHVASMSTDMDGVEEVIVRWPIDQPQTTDDAPPPRTFADGIVEGLRRVESMLRDLEGRRGLSDERRLELLSECVAAEMADVTEATQDGREVLPMPTKEER